VLYVDPSAGSILLQVAFAAIVSGVLTVKRWWGSLSQRLRSAVSRLRPRWTKAGTGTSCSTRSWPESISY